ncbi:hypothetical protein HYPSUDRAFT_90352 [Hypholoma sublateritium FD-334 SS-4]|uniref:Uncharacterized protein n=1 Tax=Hypholoma sublateritium (strain FD-334 SS-4) TaxID=945553 RepID=A0A0D2PC97_HYPSF|nr:hypothetical protein HYPSUDRAFT_90352 [Hypholoma sublateritium FD-334 SS-4]
MFTAHHDAYQSTSYEDVLTIGRPTHHPRIQESLHMNGAPIHAGYPPAMTTTTLSAQGPQTCLYSMDVRPVGLTLEGSAPGTCMDFSQYDYAIQASQATHSSIHRA